MEVQLKKTKITKNIVDQSLYAIYSVMYNWENYDILGWCVIKSGKYSIRTILLYNKASNSVVKFNYSLPSKVEIVNESVQKSDNNGGYIYPVIKKIRVLWIDLSRTFDLEQSPEETYEDMEEKFKKIKQFFTIVNEKGQIYL